MIRRVAMLSIHTCPLAMLGGKETGGMNVYVRDLSRELGRRGIAVDCFTRSQNPNLAPISTRLGPNGRVIHVPAGPEAPYDKNRIADHLPEFTRRRPRLCQARGPALRCHPQSLLALGARSPRPGTRLGCPSHPHVPHPGPDEEQRGSQPRRMGDGEAHRGRGKR